MDAQPRILHVIDHTRSGGAQVVVQYLVQELKDTFSFAVAVLGNSGRFSDAYAALGVPVFELGHNRSSLLPLLELIKLIRRRGYDLVHSHLLKSSILGVLAAKYAGKKAILHDHSDICAHLMKEMSSLSNPFLRFGYSAAYRFVLGRSDRVLVLTPAVLKAYLQNYRVDDQKITVLPNAVDVHQISRIPEHYCPRSRRNELGFSDDTRLVVMAGRLVPEKDWLTFLRVAGQVRQDSPYPCAFLLIGSGPQEGMLKDLAREQRLEHVHFLGYRDDVPELLRQADVFLLTSRREPFGIVVLEAMAAGCPVVAARTNGPESVITHGVSGLLAEVGDVQGLANHVTRLMSDDALRQGLRQRARQTVLDRYTLEAVSARMRDIYQEVLEL